MRRGLNEWIPTFPKGCPDVLDILVRPVVQLADSSMLGKNFLRSEPARHRDPAVRLEHVRSLDPENGAHQTLLAELAQGDEDDGVRRAALERLVDLRALEALTVSAGQGSEREAASSRLADCLEHDRFDTATVTARLEPASPGFARLVATHSARVECREPALACLSDEADLLSVVEHTRYHDTRLAAAARLEDEERLRQALVACRLRDKVVARQLQERLDARVDARARAEAEREATAHALHAIEELASSVWSPLHRGRLQALETRWSALPAALTVGDAPAFAEAAASVRRTIDAGESAARRAAASSDPEVGRGEAAGSATAADGEDRGPGNDVSPPVGNGSARETAPARQDDRETGDRTGVSPSRTSDEGAAQVAESASDESPSGDAATGPHGIAEAGPEAEPEPEPDPATADLRLALDVDALEALGEAVATARRHSRFADPVSVSLLAHADATAVLFDPPFAVEKGRPQAIEERRKRVSALLDTASCLPDINAGGFAHLRLLRAHAEALEQRLGKARQESADRIKATQRQFAALSELVKDGKWGPASSMLRRVQKKVERMETRERAAVAERLARAEKQLEEMADWQDFAGRPKLEALCTEMEALAAAELGSARSRADEVKRLQTEWKAIGASRSANELWPRFKLAADAAFAPAKAHFEARREERGRKTAVRKALSATVEAAAADMDWDGVDWKALQRQVAGYKREWSLNRVTDRKPDKALEARFTAALAPFETRLAAEYDRNAEARRELVARAAALADGEINQHVVNQARSLQSAWKQVGITRRREDQALWEAFNGHCRSIFKRHQSAERDRQRAELGHVYRAREIVRELKRLAAGDAPDDATVQKLVGEFEALPDFPERDRRGLQRDFRAATDAFGRARASRQRQRAAAEREEVSRLLALVEQLEEAVERPGAPETATARDEAIDGWDEGGSRVSREAMLRLERRRDAALAHLDAGTSFDWDAGETARRELLVRIEVAAGAETPDEDKSRRMRFQLENLKEGMTGGATIDRRAALEQLGLDWLAAPPVPATLRDRLNARARAALPDSGCRPR